MMLEHDLVGVGVGPRSLRHLGLSIKQATNTWIKEYLEHLEQNIWN
jgi:lysine/ornithine N-monooxygenase